MEHIKGNSGSTQQEIADALGLPKQTVNYNVDQLRKAGQITTERDGRTSRCYPAVW
jgi:DNA-binding MarR family transcriptional regulator